MDKKFSLFKICDNIKNVGIKNNKRNKYNFYPPEADDDFNTRFARLKSIMWHNWINGILGLWVMLLGFLGFPAFLSRILLIITGIVISVLSFWSTSTFYKTENSINGVDKNNSNEEV